MTNPPLSRRQRARAALSLSKLSHLLALVLGALAAAGLTIVVDQPGPDQHRTVTVRVGKATAAPAGDLAAPAPSGLNVSKPAAQSDLRDETPPDVPAGVLSAGVAKTRSLANQAGVSDVPLAVGGAQGYSVTQDFSGHVYSDFRPGITPDEFCLHYTVSPNIKGWGDVDGVQRGFKNTMAASATFIADFEAHIKQMVPLDHKAWTQGAFNPYCRASAELIATGYETRAQWLASPLFKRHVLASLVGDVLKRYNLPARFVDPQGCAAPAGWTDHNHIECGNDHLDLSPRCAFNNAINGHLLYPSYTPIGCSGFPFDVFEAQLRQATNPPPTPAQLLRAKHLRTHQRFTKNHCSRKGPNGHPRGGYCDVLRKRNADVHAQAKRQHVSLAGSYK